MDAVATVLVTLIALAACAFYARIFYSLITHLEVRHGLGRLYAHVSLRRMQLSRTRRRSDLEIAFERGVHLLRPQYSKRWGVIVIRVNDEVAQWCKAALGYVPRIDPPVDPDSWHRQTRWLGFRREADALAFKMRWF